MLDPRYATKRELIAWLEARGIFSLVHGWDNYDRAEHDMLVSEIMLADRRAASDRN